MKDSIHALAHHLARRLGRAYDPRDSGPRPCRAGELFRVSLGGRDFALKLYDEGYFNDLYLLQALRATSVPVPAIHAHDDAGTLVGKPWILMDWLPGAHQAADRHAVGMQVGQLLRAIHAIPADGAGGRTANGWQYPDWHALVQAEAGQDRQAIGALADEEANKAFYLRIVDGFVDLGRRQAKAASLLHGDLGLDNVLVDHDQVIAFIDAGWFVGGHPLMDVAYTMNSRIAEGEGMRGLVEGYGVADLDRQRDVMLLRQYHWIGKLIYFHSVGQRDKYEQRRQVLLDFALANGFREDA